MKKIIHTLLEVIRNEKIDSSSGYTKWNTNIANVFVYDVQLGWGYPNQIKKNWETYDDRIADMYKENAIIIEWKEYINNRFCGGKKIFKSESFLKENYTIEDEMEITI